MKRHCSSKATESKDRSPNSIVCETPSKYVAPLHMTESTCGPKNLPCRSHAYELVLYTYEFLNELSIRSRVSRIGFLEADESVGKIKEARDISIEDIR